MTLDDAFDRTGALRPPPLSRLFRETWSLVAYDPPRPDPTTFPDGCGQSVLVIPALMTGDFYTKGLRRYLNRCGFRSFGWLGGINLGPTSRILHHVQQRLLEVHRQAAGPVSLIGISMGGLLARNLAYDMPDKVSHVVTVGCPIRLPTATTLEPMIRIIGRRYSRSLNLDRLSRPLPVAWTSIYSRDDGLVAWQSCRAEEPGGLSVEVRAPHMSMCRHPEALRTIIRRLSPPEGQG